MKKFGVILVLFVKLQQAWAQSEITVEDIYRDKIFDPQTTREVNWMNDGQYYTALKNNKILKYDVTSGEEVQSIFDGNSSSPGIRIFGYDFSPDESKVLLLTQKRKIYRRSFTAEYIVLDLKNGNQMPLSSSGPQSYATFSPAGDKIAFVRQNDLHLVDLQSGQETQITNTGSLNKIINGSTDWAYEEELHFTKAFFWSRNGSQLAFYTFDESQVPEYNMQVWHDGQLYPSDYRFKYPKAGSRNSIVQISVFHLNTGEIVKMNIDPDEDIYIPQIQWTYDPNVLSILKLNRLQNQLDILHADSKTGESKLILRENSEQYMDVNNDDNLFYLQDGKQFVFLSDRSGFKHCYLYRIDGQLEHQITLGNWEVTDVIGIDQTKRIPELYYLSTEGSPLERNFFLTDLNGIKKTRLAEEGGINTISMSRDFKFYLRYFDNSETPLNVTLYQTRNNKPTKTLQDNSALSAVVKEHVVVPKEFFQFSTSDGVQLNGFLLKPRDFRSDQKYPLLIYQYGGPGSQEVQNEFGARRYYWHQLLVQKGYLVAYIDPRGTGGRGSEFAKVTYGQLGKYETQDLIEGAKYLGSQDYVDADRIGIWGWSYGGYTAALCMMLGSEVFKAGISVSPVTSWRFYDTIYTERYLKRPEDNPSGYDDYSPITHADKLKGKFLLIHGTGDDNVHFQNSVALQTRLIEAGKQFQSFYYPDKAHSISGDKAQVHLFQMMTNFIVENL